MGEFNTIGVLTGIKPIEYGRRIVGPAFTVKSCLIEKAGNVSKLEGLISYIDEINKGEILIIDSGGLNISSVGGLAAFHLKNKEVDGAVVDGGIRDIEEIREVNFRIFIRHTTPLTGKQRIGVISWNNPVFCAGILVRAGDLMVADDTGAVRVPLDLVEQVLKYCKKKEAKEEQIEKKILNGDKLSDLYG